MLRLWRNRRCEGETAAQARAACLSSQMRKVRRQGTDPEARRQAGHRRSAELLTQSWIDFDQAEVFLTAIGIATGILRPCLVKRA